MAAAAAAAAAASAAGSAKCTLDSEEDVLQSTQGCVQWLGQFVNYEEKRKVAQAGLFRVPPADLTLNMLRDAMKDEGGEAVAPYEKIKAFVEENHAKRGIVECSNAVASVLKQNLRNLCKPILPFKFCTEDLCSYGLDKVRDDEQRAEIGAFMAQDLIHVIVSHHAECRNETIKGMIVLIAQLFALLCSVTRTPVFQMSSYDLFVPFLPSICGARDPMEFMAEHNAIKVLNDSRRRAEIEGGAIPKTRLELLIQYGQRIWGYITASASSLDDAIQALREYDQLHVGKMEEGGASAHHVRKRDLLKKALKVHRWFRKKPEPELHSKAAADPPLGAATFTNSSHNRNLRSQSSNVAKIDEAVVMDAPYTFENTSVFQENPKLRTNNRIMSVRLTSHPSGEIQAATFGKSLFRRATSSEDGA